MTYAFGQLFVGIALAVVLIYLLIVVNFQSWLDPFVIVSALPTALAGIVWMLFITRTTLSVPALTGAIMCMGVATANSILVVSFARERLAEGADAATAAIDAGFTRFRPVLMTALAMIIGMAPMALSEELNAPLGRAVIGGLVCATVATLLFVPAVFRLVHERKPSRGERVRAEPSRRGLADMSQDHAEDFAAAPEYRVDDPKPLAKGAEVDAKAPEARGADREPDRKEHRPVKAWRAILLLAVGAIAVAYTGISGRRHDDEKLKQWTQEQAIPPVAVVTPKRGGEVRELVLPGNVDAFYSADIHGQVKGYVQEWRKDIGAKVHQGDVLAVVDTPELDQSIAVAQSELAKAKANLALAKVTAARWNSLRATARGVSAGRRRKGQRPACDRPPRSTPRSRTSIG